MTVRISVNAPAAQQQYAKKPNLIPHKIPDFAGSPLIGLKRSGKARPFQGFACGKTLDAAPAADARCASGKFFYFWMTVRISVNAPAAQQ